MGYQHKRETRYETELFMNPPLSFSRVSAILITLAAAVILLAGIQAASAVLGPILFSIYLALVFGMLLHWFEKKGLSGRSALALTLLVFFAIVALFVVAIAGSFLQFLADLPHYLQKLESSLGLVTPALAAIGIDPASLTFRNLAGSFAAVIGTLIGDIFAIASPLFLILLTTLFLIFEAKGFSRKLRAVIGDLCPGDLDRFTALAEKNVDYIVIRTRVNLVMGIGTAVILSLIGVKYAIFWGFLAFLLGFIPNIGFWIAVVPPALLAWFDLGAVPALLVVAGSGLMDLLAEYLLFPGLASRGLDLSAAVVFISLFFWGWILGGIGVLLAVPLTLLVRMLCELSDETRWIAVLLGPSPGGDGRNS